MTVDVCCDQKPLRARYTQPQPFNLTLDKKRKREAETTERYKFDTPLGEKVLRFTSKTPERFRAKNGLCYLIDNVILS